MKLEATRRKFFGIMGVSPLVAKGVADEAIANNAGIWDTKGLGDASLRLFSGGDDVPEHIEDSTYVPHDQRVIRAADFIKLSGIPDYLEDQLRDEARAVSYLDPDIACKRSWSMSVKIVTQRQRNYERSLKRVQTAGSLRRNKIALKKLLGFDWPW